MNNFNDFGKSGLIRSYDEASVAKKMVRIRKALGIKRCELARILGVRIHHLAHIELRFRGNSLCYILMLKFYRSVGVDLNLLFDEAEYPDCKLEQIRRSPELRKVVLAACVGKGRF